jgi:L-serine deaminase
MPVKVDPLTSKLSRESSPTCAAMAQRSQTAALLDRLAKLARRSIHGQACVARAQPGECIKVGGGHLRPQTASPIAEPRRSNGFRGLSTTALSSFDGNGEQGGESDVLREGYQEHAIISAFDLFSVGIGPSSSHTVGPMRAGNIFVTDLIEAGMLHKVNRIRISIYGSLALTGAGHMTPSALLLGLEGANVESVDTAYVPTRFAEIKESKKLCLGGGGSTNPREIDFDYGRDFVWEWSRNLPMHSNGMRFRVFDENGDMLATNDLSSVGGGFVINGNMSTSLYQTPSDTQLLQQKAGAENQSAQAAEPTGSKRHPAALSENLFYKEIKRSHAAEERRTGSDYDFRSRETSSEQALQPFLPEAGSKSLVIGHPGPMSGEPRHAPYLFRSAKDLLALCKQHNLTIAQLMFENEKGLGMQEHEIFDQLFHLWDVMDNCIREGVQAPSHAALPGSLKLRRRAPALYQQLTRGLYPEHTQVQPTAASPQIQGPSSSAEKDTLAIAGKTEASSRPPALRRAAAMRQRQPPRRLHGSRHHPISVSPYAVPRCQQWTTSRSML